jgi:hypothetical protein
MSYNFPNSLIYYTVSGIDGKATASTKICTTSGTRFTPVSLIVECTNVDTFAVAASASVGTNSTDYNNVLAITAFTGVGVLNSTLQIPISALSTSVAAVTDIYLKITTGATATTLTLKVTLVGVYN